MAFRHLYISNKAYISTSRNQLVICQDEEYSIPLEDISSVIIESKTSTITSQAMSAMAEKGVLVFTCDEKHLPNGILLPFAQHSRQLLVIESQINMARPLQKRLWQKIIVYKVENQARVLESLGLEGGDYLRALSKRVESGDKGSIESIAAARYFGWLFGERFVRRSENVVNAALNYGYALMRGLVARGITLHGYIPAIGLFHHGQLNNFNLADDLLEPYRPVIDLCVAQIIGDEEFLTREHKQSLFNTFNAPIEMNESHFSITSSVEIMTSSFTSALLSKNPEALRLPLIIQE